MATIAAERRETRNLLDDDTAAGLAISRNGLLSTNEFYVVEYMAYQ